MKKMNKNKRKKLSFPALFGIAFLSVTIISGNAVYYKLKSTPEIEVKKVSAEKTNDPMLILVNRTHKISCGYNGELILLDCGKYVDSRIYPQLQKMFDDMRDEGIYPIVNEGYRTNEEQEQMMEDKINAYLNEGYSEKLAKKLAEESVAPPGMSEHELGIAVDIVADKSKSDNEEVYSWLAENAHKYGFIQRYPQDKTNITGFEYEPWHYRYVGSEAAADIHEQGLCLEEYLEL